MDKKLLWTHSGIASATGGSILKNFNVYGISIDSRTLQEGDLFIAIKSKKDGHYYVNNASKSGASAAIVSWKHKSVRRDFPLVFVKNTYESLISLANASRARCEGKMVGITGSAGKTTTKSLLAHILSKSYETHSAEGSYNNHYGVPLTLARMPAETEFGVFEIGMNREKEIFNLSKMVRPHIGIITTIGAGHIEFFRSEEHIAIAKSEIIYNISAGGSVLINNDNKHYKILESTAKENNIEIVTFGEKEDSDIRLLSYENNDEKSKITLNIKGNELKINSMLQGKHNAMNIAAIMGTLDKMGLDLKKSAEDLADFSAPEGRGAIKVIKTEKDKEITLIDESYNANPVSMKAALDNIKDLSPKKDGLKIAVLGKMGELGSQSKHYHQDLSESVKSCNFDRIYMIGQDMEHLYEELGEEAPSIFALSLDDIIKEIIDDTIDGSVIFIKGSNSVGLKSLVDSFDN